MDNIVKIILIIVFAYFAWSFFLLFISNEKGDHITKNNIKLIKSTPLSALLEVLKMYFEDRTRNK